MTNKSPQTLKEEDWKKWAITLANSTNPRDTDLLIVKIELLLSSTIDCTLERVEKIINPNTIAEKIVIEYANISGRESDYRMFVRDAARKIILSALEDIQKGV